MIDLNNVIFNQNSRFFRNRLKEQKMKKTVCGLLAVCWIFALSAGELVLVRDGKAESVILTKENPNPHEKLAAKELSYWVKRISGAELPAATSPVAGKTKIVLADLEQGKALLVPAVVKKLEKATSKEAYYITSSEGTLYIAGKSPAGTLYGTYAFLEDFLGMCFFHAGAEYVPSKKAISVKDPDLFRQPWLGQRMLNEWAGSVKPFSLDDFHIWMTRRAFSWNERSVSKKLKDYAPCGGKRFQGGRHLTFEKSVPKKLFATHPEYFPLQDGKRVCKDRSQRCLTNPDVQNLLEEYIFTCLKRGMTFALGYHDSTDGFCSCEACVKSGLGEDGKFTYSNYAHNFNRKMAERVLAKDPKAELFYDIYSVFRDFPTVKDFHYPPGVTGEFCPHGRCYAHPMENSECNTFHNELMLKWGASSQIGVYDYYCYANAVYCPMEYVMAQDMKTYAKRKIRYFMDDCSNRSAQYPLANWPFYFVMSKVYWDLDLDVEKLMEKVYTLYYGKAAGPMKEYHAFRRKLWDAAPGHAVYNGSGTKRQAQCLVIPELEKHALSLLDKAEKLAAGDKELSGRIAIDREFLTKYWIAEAKKLREASKGTKTVPVGFRKGEIVIDGRLDEDAWKSAPLVGGFLRSGTKDPSTEVTNARVLFDDDNFYIGVEAMTEHAWSELKAKAKEHDSEVWKDDCIEIFIVPPGDPSHYFHWVVNSAGAFYDAEVRNASFQSAAEVKTTRKGNSYTVEMKIPASCMKRNKIRKGEAWKIHFTREIRCLQPPADRESSGLDGVDSHQYLYFRPAVLGQEVVRNGSFTLLEKPDEKKVKARKITSEFLPKFWSAHHGGLRREKDGKYALETKGSVIYTYLNLPRTGKETRLTGYVVVSGKGQLQIYFSGCIRKKGDKRKFANEIKHVVKNVVLTEEKQTVEVDFTAEPDSQYYLEFKAVGHAIIHEAVLAR